LPSSRVSVKYAQSRKKNLRIAVLFANIRDEAEETGELGA
jgi:hypothetical protein